jgi:hypothetical protein
MINVPYFYVSLEELTDLPTPTPMKNLSFTINGEEYWISNFSPDTDYIAQAYKYLRQGKTIPEEEFEFSDAAKNAAQFKLDLL